MSNYYYSADQDLYEEILGRGPGDPDVHGYPGEVEATTPRHYKCQDFFHPWDKNCPERIIRSIKHEEIQGG